jgi:hypothetical protein
MLETYVQKEGATSILARALPDTHIIDLQELEVPAPLSQSGLIDLPTISPYPCFE